MLLRGTVMGGAPLQSDAMKPVVALIWGQSKALENTSIKLENVLRCG